VQDKNTNGVETEYDI